LRRAFQLAEASFFFTLWRLKMIKTLIAAAVAGAFALPFAAQASALGDNMVLAQGGGDTGASSRQEGVNPPGAVSPGTPSTAVTGTDRDTGAAARTNPHGANDRSRSSSAGGTSASGFERLDKNRDGFISRDEARDAKELDTRFSELDVNNDGKLSRDEYNAVHRGASGATSDTRAHDRGMNRGATPSTTQSGGAMSAPSDKGPGAQESATRPQGESTQK
jgi:hypothetical protein